MSAETAEHRRLTYSSNQEFDDVFKHHIKEFGRYQNCLYWLTYYVFIPLGLQFGLMVFVTGTPNFRCSDVNSTCELNKCCKECTDYTFEGAFTSIVSEVGVLHFVVAVFLYAQADNALIRDFASDLEVFDVPVLYFLIFFFQWNLICDRKEKAATSQALFLAGMLTGSFLCGIISDTYGRRLCLFVSMALLVNHRCLFEHYTQTRA